MSLGGRHRAGQRDVVTGADSGHSSVVSTASNDESGRMVAHGTTTCIIQR